MFELLPTTPTIWRELTLTELDHERFSVPVLRYPDLVKRWEGYLAMNRWPFAVVDVMAAFKSRVSFMTSRRLRPAVVMGMTLICVVAITESTYPEPYT